MDKNLIRSTLTIIVFLVTISLYAQNNERYFGFHFDFHAAFEDSLIGKDFNYDEINNLFSKLKPDFIQVDVKGHKGYSSYPTNIGARTANYYNDPLKFWQRICEANNIKLYAHYSGLVDQNAATIHPQWALKNSSGNASDKMSMFSNYVDSLLIPQINELISKYNFDGVWFDGDSWALETDYSQAAKIEFQSEFNTADIPANADDINFSNYLNFTRKAFLNYLKEVSDKIHSIDPSFKVTSNWAFSTSMPYGYNNSLDFLSGDLSGNDWIMNAAFQSRFFDSYDLPWDLMSWSFAPGRLKPINLLLYEASEVISMGGGYHTYWIQNRNASLSSSYFPLMEKLSYFCREREEYCHNLETVPQVGIFFLKDSWEKNKKSPFSGDGQEAIKGIMAMLLDNKYSVSFLRSDNKDKFKDYPLLVVPEWKFISKTDKDEMTNYIKGGGNLLIIGVEACENFRQELGIGRSNQKLIIRSLGKGKIAGLLRNIGDDYYREQEPDLFNIIDPALQNFIKPIIKIPGNKKIHINISRKQNDYYFHLINVNSLNHSDNLDQFENISPLKNIKIEISLPEANYIQEFPSNKIINFQRNQNLVSFVIPNLEIYSIIKVTP